MTLRFKIPLADRSGVGERCRVEGVRVMTRVSAPLPAPDLIATLGDLTQSARDSPYLYG